MINFIYMDKMIGLRDLRENTDTYINRVSEGESFVVYRRLKPVFKITSPEDEQWEELIDFTKLKKGGIEIKDLLSRLRKIKNGQNQQSVKETTRRRKKGNRGNTTANRR